MLGHRLRIGVEVFRVGFQVDNPLVGQQLCVARQEERCREAFLCTARFELRIGEGDPDLGHLTLGKERGDELDARAQEADIRHVAFGRSLGTAPHTRPLDVDADVVAIGIALGKADRIFALTAPQFEDDRTIVVEELLVPMPLQGVIAREYAVELGLQEAGKGLIFAEFPQFIFSHSDYSSVVIFRPTASTPSIGRVGVSTK